MTAHDLSGINAEVVIRAMKISRVALRDDRPAVVADALRSLIGETGSLFELDLGEIIPAPTFDPRRIG